MPEGRLRVPFDGWGLFTTVHTASDNLATSFTDCLYSRDTMVCNVKTLSLRLTTTRERVGQTKQVQVRDDVRESYTNSGALQLRTATTAPEAWEATDSCCREGVHNRSK